MLSMHFAAACQTIELIVMMCLWAASFKTVRCEGVSSVARLALVAIFRYYDTYGHEVQ